MGGIVAGTVATCAAYAVYQVLKSPTKGINKLRDGN